MNKWYFLLTIFVATGLWACGDSDAAMHRRPILIGPTTVTVATTGETPLRVQWNHADGEAVSRTYWYLHTKPHDRRAYLDASTTDPLTAMLSVYPSEGKVDSTASYLVDVHAYDRNELDSSCTINVVYRPNRNPTVTCTVPKADLPGRAQQVRCRFSDADGDELQAIRWQLLTVPEGVVDEQLAGVLRWSRQDRLTTSFTPPMFGEYTLRVIVEDPFGGKAYRDLVLGTIPNTSPAVTCPPAKTVSASETFTLEAQVTDVDAGDRIVSTVWSVVKKPVGSKMEPTPTDQLVTTLAADFFGDYRLQFAATDSYGGVSTCTADISVEIVDDLVIQMWWTKAPGQQGDDVSDVDLHLLKPGGSWKDREDHCHWANCRSGTQHQMINADGRPVSPLKWHKEAEANPRLDFDHIDGNGREVINLEKPKPGIYKVLANYYDPHKTGKVGSQVGLKIYCQGKEALTVDPGPVLFAWYGERTENNGEYSKPIDVWGGEMYLPDSREFEVWEVATVTFATDGSCEVKPIGSPTCQRVCSWAEFWPAKGGSGKCPDSACRATSN